jgi:hypothetical protein
VSPYVVKIETPNGHGTGFVCIYNERKTFVGIATALHVVAHADEWQQPVRIQHQASKTTTFLRENEWVIMPDWRTDSAVILTQVGQLDLPQELIPVLPIDRRLPIGAEVGWIGYPAVHRYTQCFFSGRVSAFQEERHAYLIDGVAINGVSGGPALYYDETGIQIVGFISAYIPNRATGEALPGLSVAQDLSHMHATIATMKTWDEAAKKAAQEAAAGQSKNAVERTSGEAESQEGHDSNEADSD